MNTGFTYVIKYLAFFIVAVTTFVLSGCDHLGILKLKEGEITFKVSYPGQEDNMMTAIMPNKMSLKFKKDKTISEFNAGMGLFYMCLITNPENKTLTQQVKVLSEQKGITFSEEDLKKILKEEPKMKIELKSETKEIAGYKCKKATVTFPDEEREPFDIFYTKQIQIKNPNWYNQFNQIDGVILEYQVKRWGIETRFEAVSVEKKEVDEKLFLPSPEYRLVSQQEIDEIFENFTQ
jgi:GLPGLI family protein